MSTEEKAKQSRKPFNWRFVWVAVAVVLALILIYIGFKGWLNTFIGQMFAIAFFVAAIYGVHRTWWQAGTCLILLILSACIFFASQPWMQGFIDQTALRVLLNLGERAGQKLDDFQKTTTAIQGQVQTHQDELDKHQRDISAAQTTLLVQALTNASQQAIIATQQGDLATQQAKLNEQQKKLDDQQRQLSDIGDLVRNFFSRIRIEQYQGSDTNHVFMFTQDNKACMVFFQLKNVAVPGSITGNANEFSFQSGVMNNLKNIAYGWFMGATNDMWNARFGFNYFEDTPNNDKKLTLEIRDGEPYLNGVRFSPFRETNSVPAKTSDRSGK
jgi:hypothetical protein